MPKTVIIRLPAQPARRDAKGKPIPPPAIDAESMNRDLTHELEKAMSEKLGELTVSLDYGLSFKLTLEGEWQNRKESQAQVLEIFGEVMDNFDSSGYAL